jgi:hypothetical protein
MRFTRTTGPQKDRATGCFPDGKAAIRWSPKDRAIRLNQSSSQIAPAGLTQFLTLPNGPFHPVSTTLPPMTRLANGYHPFTTASGQADQAPQQQVGTIPLTGYPQLAPSRLTRGTPQRFRSPLPGPSRTGRLSRRPSSSPWAPRGPRPSRPERPTSGARGRSGLKPSSPGWWSRKFRWASATITRRNHSGRRGGTGARGEAAGGKPQSNKTPPGSKGRGRPCGPDRSPSELPGRPVDHSCWRPRIRPAASAGHALPFASPLG